MLKQIIFQSSFISRARRTKILCRIYLGGPVVCYRLINKMANNASYAQ